MSGIPWQPATNTVQEKLERTAISAVDRVIGCPAQLPEILPVKFRLTCKKDIKEFK